jgi:hypothetical protein
VIGISFGIFPSSFAETAGRRYGVPVARVSGVVSV